MGGCHSRQWENGFTAVQTRLKNPTPHNSVVHFLTFSLYWINDKHILAQLAQFFLIHKQRLLHRVCKWRQNKHIWLNKNAHFPLSCDHIMFSFEKSWMLYPSQPILAFTHLLKDLSSFAVPIYLPVEHCAFLVRNINSVSGPRRVSVRHFFR